MKQFDLKFKDGAAFWTYCQSRVREDLYLILDGAFSLDFAAQLKSSGLMYEPLYTGDLDGGLEKTCPFLIRVKADNPFVQTLLDESFDEPFGVFFFVSKDVIFSRIRRHLRKFLMIRLRGKRVYFRFYDPRVLEVTLPVFASAQQALFLGETREWLTTTGLIFQNPSPALRQGNVLALDADQAKLIDAAKLAQYADEVHEHLEEVFGQDEALPLPEVRSLLHYFFFQCGLQQRRFLYQMVEFNQQLGLRFFEKSPYQQIKDVIERSDFSEALKLMQTKEVIKEHG